MFEIELRRAFSKKFFICLLIGTVIVILDFWSRAPYMMSNMAFTKEQIKNGVFIYEPALSAYALWMGTTISKWHTLFMRLMPLLIAIPYGASLCFDRRGYQIQLMARSSRKRYYASKYVVQFLCGGTLAVLPQMFQIVLCAVCIPFSQPLSYTFYYPVWENTFLSGIFYSQTHLVYILTYLVVNFIGYGLLGMTCCVAALWEKNRYVSTVVPLLCAYIVHAAALLYAPLRKASIFIYPAMFNIERPQVKIVLLSWGIYAVIVISAFLIDIRRGE